MKKGYYAIIAPLLVSLFIYLFYRTEKTLVNEIVIRLITPDSYAALKKAVTGALPLGAFVVYSLPEGLWVFCITRTSGPYYIRLAGRRVDCLVIPLLYCVGLETAQLLHLTNGRFDPVDILVAALGWLVAAFASGDPPGGQNLLAPLNGSRMVCFATYGIVCLSHVLQ